MSRRDGSTYAGAMTTNTEREARLAAQLRANLKRRKAQARGDVPVPPEVEPDLKR